MMITLKNVQTVPPTTLQNLANNYNIAKNLRDSFPNPYTLEDAQKFLKLVGNGLLKHVFAIYCDREFIGIGGVTPKEDIYRNNGEIGYWLGEPFWRKGYGSQVVRLLTAYAFNELGLVRVYGGVFAGNIASMRVLEKAGYQLEAVIKCSITKHDQIINEHLYSILRNDYYSMQNE